MRQPREPAARAHACAGEGDRRPHGSRCEPRACRAATPHGGSVAWRRGWCRGLSRIVLWRPSACGRVWNRAPAGGRDCAGRPRPGVHCRHRDRDGPRRRRCSGVAPDRARCERGAQTGTRARQFLRRRRPREKSPCRVRGCARVDAARRCGAADEKSRQPAIGRSRIRCPQCADGDRRHSRREVPNVRGEEHLLRSGAAEHPRAAGRGGGSHRRHASAARRIGTVRGHRRQACRSAIGAAGCRRSRELAGVLRHSPYPARRRPGLRRRRLARTAIGGDREQAGGCAFLARSESHREAPHARDALRRASRGRWGRRRGEDRPTRRARPGARDLSASGAEGRHRNDPRGPYVGPARAPLECRHRRRSCG